MHNNTQQNEPPPKSAVPPEKMTASARRMRDFYAKKPEAPLYQHEFGYLCLDAWNQQGMPQDVPHEELFGLDTGGLFELLGLGSCEAEFFPAFEEKALEDRGEHELVQDFAGRKVLYFKGRRQGFMPEYLDHPVKDMETWEELCKWRLAPNTSGRFDRTAKCVADGTQAASTGAIICQRMIGGYMYLRSLMGPQDLLYKFHDDPALIHDCMETWLKLADAVTAEHQKSLTLDEVSIAEDICYNNGLLISPDMVREFLFPYYRELLDNIKKRQIDKNRHLYFHVDSDGNVAQAIPLYMELGMDSISPFEVASGSDVVEIGKRYPELLLSGGVDKRILAQDKKAIDEMVDRIFPAMKKRGGYIPTCDHCVPAEVRYENYMHYRKRCLEFAS